LRELLIGCGSNRAKKLQRGGRAEWSALTTLDHNSDHNPDVVFDLESGPLPFDDDSFDEIHAYEVLEHTGAQGDYRFFFSQWSDFWRVLKPGGAFMGTVPLPSSVWAWGDPSHRRIVARESLIFLNQPTYDAQVGKTPMSDFRNIYKADFDIAWMEETDHSLMFILEAVKPSRCSL